MVSTWLIYLIGVSRALRIFFAIFAIMCGIIYFKSKDAKTTMWALILCIICTLLAIFIPNSEVFYTLLY